MDNGSAGAEGADWGQLVAAAEMPAAEVWARLRNRRRGSGAGGSDAGSIASAPLGRGLPLGSPLAEGRLSLPTPHAQSALAAHLYPGRGLASLPEPALGSEAPPASYLLLPSVASFWKNLHPIFPLLHRTSFEAAFAPAPVRPGAAPPRSSLAYPNGKPLILLYAIAANGARTLPNLSEAQRFGFARYCCEKAREMLLARQSDDLESAQALALLLNNLVAAGLPARMAPLLDRAAQAAQALYLNLPTDPPTRADQWIYKELVVRLRTLVCFFDQGAAWYAQTPTVGSYFYPHEWPVPCGERWFDDADPERAHADLLSHRSGAPEPTLHLGDLMGAGVIDVVRGLASATFGGTGSVLCMLQLANHGRHLIMTLLRMGGGPAGAGSLVREGTAFLAQVADAFLRALPARLGPSMAIGDAAALFASSDLYFPRPGHAFSALQSMIFTEEHAVEMFLAGGFRRAALERALRLARLLDGMLRAQPGFQWGHYLVIPPAFKVGAALLSAYVDESRSVPWETREQAGERVARVREYEVGARTVDSVLGALGRSYGLQPRRVARKFARMMLAAGIAVAMPPEEAEELLDVVEGEKPGFFWDALIAQADVAKAGSRGMLGAGL